MVGSLKLKLDENKFDYDDFISFSIISLIFIIPFNTHIFNLFVFFSIFMWVFKISNVGLNRFTIPFSLIFFISIFFIRALSNFWSDSLVHTSFYSIWEPIGDFAFKPYIFVQYSWIVLVVILFLIHKINRKFLIAGMILSAVLGFIGIINYLLFLKQAQSLYSFSGLYALEYNSDYFALFLIFAFRFIGSFYLKTFILFFISYLILINKYQTGDIYGAFFNSIDFSFRRDFFYLLLIPIILSSFKRKYVGFSIHIFIFSMFISEIVSYGIIFGFWTTDTGTISNPTPFIGDHAEYSILLVIAIFWLLELIRREDSSKLKFFYGLFFITATLNLFFNAGRTGQVLYFFMLLFYILYHYGISFRTIFIGFLTTVFIFIFLFNVSPVFKNRISLGFNNIEKAIIYNDYGSGWGVRLLLYKVGYKVLKESPLIGEGIGNTSYNIHHSVTNNLNEKEREFLLNVNHLHNDVLNIFVETGIVGIILYILFYYFSFKSSYDSEVRYFIYSLLFIFLLGNFIQSFWVLKNNTFIEFIVFISIFSLFLHKRSV